MNIRTLIIPDLHLKWQKADTIISHVAADKIVFLGDYFDDFGDNPITNQVMAEWVKNSLDQPNRIHLMGNHDTNYAFRHRSYKCSGYTSAKEQSINTILKEGDWRKMPLYTKVGSWLCSHAGVHNHLYEQYGNKLDFYKWLDHACNVALETAFANKPAVSILRAGRSRGGTETVGGINWCDADEFRAIASINQVFGHTPQTEPRWINTGSSLSKQYSQNLCLDVDNANCYAIHDSDTDKIKEYHIVEQIKLKNTI